MKEDYMTSNLPKDLMDMPIWTVSNADKVPLDPKDLIYNNTETYFKPAIHTLMPFETVYTYLQEMKNPNLKLAIKLTREIPYCVVDIEPEGMMQDNPYFSFPYIYLEYSRNKGLHGILPFNPPKEFDYLSDKFAVKDKVWETETLIGNDHFATFTLNELPLDQYKQRLQYSKSADFQQRFAEYIKEKTNDIIEVDEKAAIDDLTEGFDSFQQMVNIPLEDTDKANMDKVLAKTEMLFEGAKSEEEYRKILEIYGRLTTIDKMYLSNSWLTTRTIPIMWQMINQRIHFRTKHRDNRNSKYGAVPWLAYTLISGIEYIRNQSLEDKYRKNYVTK